MFPKFSKFIKSNNGFTFIEVMISITILSVVVVPLLTLIPQNFRSLAKANKRAVLLNMAKNVDSYYMSLAYMGGGVLIINSPSGAILLADGSKNTGKIVDLGFNMEGIEDAHRYRFELEHLNSATHDGYTGLLYVTVRIFYDHNDLDPVDNSIDNFTDADPDLYIEYVTAYARPDKDGSSVY